MENISWLCSNASVGVLRSIRNHRRHRCLVTGALIVCPLCLSLLLTCSSLNVRIWCIQPRKSCGNRDGRVGRTCLARNSRHYARTISDYFIVAKVERCLVIAAVTWMPIRPGLWAEWTYRGHLASEVTSSSDEVNEGRSIQNCGVVRNCFGHRKCSQRVLVSGFGFAGNNRCTPPPAYISLSMLPGVAFPSRFHACIRLLGKSSYRRRQ